MSTIKKAFAPIMSLLAANAALTCEEIYDQALALTSAKAGGGGAVSSFHKDEDGQVLIAKCGYHGLFFNTAEVEFGKKASAASGLNTMCKDGTSKWTKQLAQFKKAKDQLLTDVGAGDVAATDISAVTAELEEARNEVVAIDGVVGYATLDEAIAAL